MTPLSSLRDRTSALAAVARTFVTPFERPDRLPRAMLAAWPWHGGVAALAAAAAARTPTAVAVVDDEGELTYAALWSRAHALAAWLRSQGAEAGTAVGLLARNHRHLVVGTVAIAMTGADLVLLNTGFAAPQVRDVVASEGITVVLRDDDLPDVGAGTAVDDTALDGTGPDGTGHDADPTGVTWSTWSDLEAVVSAGVLDGVRVTPPAREGRTILLTSGTTGRPKGAARRSDPSAAEGVTGLLARIPLRVGDVQVVAAPLFHAWGFAHLMLGLARSATTVLHRRFDAEQVIADVDRHDARVVVAVPVMLQRILAVPADRLARHDAGSLEVVAVSGSALGAALATAWHDRFGPSLYNTYGSTEVALASVATPDDLLRRPDTVGRPVIGARVEILGPAGESLPVGTVGRVFVGNAGRFEGYTTGGGKESIRGLLSTGDLGHLDADGLLYVDGREDDMVVSGGENLFPAEVEDLLRGHPAVADVAVRGVPDSEFGQVLAAHVVLAPSTSAEGAEVTADELRQFVRDHLARFKVPKSIVFTDEIPRTVTGKIVHRELPDPPG